RPNLDVNHPDREPENLAITFDPVSAQYSFDHEGLHLHTELLPPIDDIAISMRVTVTNNRDKDIRLTAIPNLLPFISEAQLSPHDDPEWWTKTSLVRIKEAVGFLVRTFDGNAVKANRRNMILWSEARDCTAAEISQEKFVGMGTLETPEALQKEKLRLSPEQAAAWGEEGEAQLYGYPQTNALQYDFTLKKNESKTIRQVLVMFEPREDGALPPKREADKMAAYLKDEVIEKQREKIIKEHMPVFHTRKVNTPDKDLNTYTNEWLSLQTYWGKHLTYPFFTLKGVRDAANHFIPLIPMYPDFCRDNIKLLYTCQRNDGWFPRQYNPRGRNAKQDLRKHVDAGNWITEYIYEYICYTKDYG
ncbi:MAG TPA: hypothetical protein VKS21_05140, partial [Spirochaetota bacterium]|nr:hypothetical protein [Spirochaetota bacterium]